MSSTRLVCDSRPRDRVSNLCRPRPGQAGQWHPIRHPTTQVSVCRETTQKKDGPRRQRDMQPGYRWHTRTLLHTSDCMRGMVQTEEGHLSYDRFCVTYVHLSSKLSMGGKLSKREGVLFHWWLFSSNQSDILQPFYPHINLI